MAKDWKNTALDMDEFGSSRPALKAETIKPDTATVITVKDVEKLEVNDPESDSGKRVSLVLQSEEYPDRGFWLNKSGIKTLTEQVSARPADWIGERVPLVVVRVNNPRTGSIQNSLQVASAAEWDDVLAGFAAAKARRGRKTVEVQRRVKTRAKSRAKARKK